MSKNFERELLEVAQWYTFHKDEPMDIGERLWALGLSAEEIQILEGRLRTRS